MDNTGPTNFYHSAALTTHILRSVVWARYKERDARFAAGLESSFSSFGETSLVSYIELLFTTDFVVEYFVPYIGT